MTEAKEIKWHKIAEDASSIYWQLNKMAVIDVNGKKIGLALINEIIFAFSYKCPHASGIMTDGFVDVLGNVVCPLHRYKFNPKNGRNISGEGYYLKTYPVLQKKDGVFIGFEEGGIFSFLK